MSVSARVLDLGYFTGRQGVILQGSAPDDSAGNSVSSAGDVNGDGIDDLLIGASGNDNGGYNAGEAYVIFGRVSATRADIDLGNLDANDGFVIQGDTGDGVGANVSSAGDVNGDGIDDLLVSKAGANGGEAYVIYGKVGATRSRIDLSSLSSGDGFIIQGAGGTGWTVSSVGDVNGDGIDDVIVGAIASNNGKAYVIFGSAGATRADVNLANLTKSEGFSIGNGSIQYVGWSVSSAGDVNGDGIDDIILGTPFAGYRGPMSGVSYVVYGRSTAAREDIDLHNLASGDGFIIMGDGAFRYGAANTGWSVDSAGDVNGDGIDDIIIGAPGGDSGGIDFGDAYVIFGQIGSTRENIELGSLSILDGFIIRGSASGDKVGRSVSSAGDVNGDGLDDIIVGAPYNDNGGTNAGGAYVIFGRSGSARGNIDLVSLTADDGFIIQGADLGVPSRMIT